MTANVNNVKIKWRKTAVFNAVFVNNKEKNMKKNLLITLLCLLLATVLAFGVAACNSNTDPGGNFGNHRGEAEEGGGNNGFRPVSFLLEAMETE